MENKRFDYFYEENIRGYLVEGHRLPGVTSILSATKLDHDKKRLTDWVASNPELSKEALTRGTWLHNQLENYLLTGEVCSDVKNPYYPYWLSIFPVIKQYVIRPLLIESCIWDFDQRYAGSMDLLCLWGPEEKVALVDYKTAAKTKSKSMIEDYFCQLIAYKDAAQKNYGIEIEQCIILLATPGKIAQRQTFKFQEEEDHYRDIWRNRVQNYWAAKGVGLVEASVS